MNTGTRRSSKESPMPEDLGETRLRKHLCKTTGAKGLADLDALLDRVYARALEHFAQSCDETALLALTDNARHYARSYATRARRMAAGENWSRR